MSQVCSTTDLQIEIITAYNFIVDNNIESPAGIPLRAAHIGARFCNTSADTLVNVFAYVGDYTGPVGNGGTPGIYPSVTCPNGTWPNLTGTFSLLQVEGTHNAIRWIGTLLPGQCIVQYWLIEYPLLDDNGTAVFGSCPDITDDLRLDYDIWARFSSDETPGLSCYNYETRTATMRCEISAMANKIWPNVPSQVPQEYLDALTAQGYDPGWNFDVSANVGEILHLQGIWYSFGNVNQGYDNNGDFVPDYNAWVQPVGDPTSLNPSCYRLVHVHGFLLVKTPDLGITVIPFEDQMYFENLDPDNTNVSGLVFYDFLAVNGPCASYLTPYQEAASGANSEKFNGDFGTGFSSNVLPPAVTFTKSVNQATTSVNSNLTYILDVTNGGTTSMGFPEFGLPLVLHEEIPAGMEYIGGSASSVSGPYTFTLLYSIDHGSNWTSIEPVPASTVTDIQWWMVQPLPAGVSIQVNFMLHVPSGYTSNLVQNWADLQFGNDSPFETDDALTFITGTNSIGDLVWTDNGSGTGGIRADGVQNGTEPGIQYATIQLYYDLDNSGTVSSSDFLWGSASTNVAGAYSFTGLPNGKWIVVLDETSVTSQLGYSTFGLTTPSSYLVTFNSGNQTYLTADFGFTAPLSITKTALSYAYNEGDTVTYSIQVKNNLYNAVASEGGGVDTCVYYSWAGFNTQDGGNKWTSINNGLGAPNGTFTSSGFTTSPQRLRSSKWNFGDRTGQTITKVEAMIVYYSNGNDVDDVVEYALTQYPGPTDLYTTSFAPAFFPAPANADTVLINVTSHKASWYWTDFPNTAGSGVGIDLNGSRLGTTSDNLFVDAVGFRVSATCTDAQQGGSGEFDQHKSISPLPLKDTFDLARLIFVSSSLPYDTLNGNILTWNNIGPLNPGATKTIILKFVAKEMKTNSCTSDSADNKSTSKNPSFADGVAANFASDTARVSVTGRSSISGNIWRDGNSNGWQGVNGYENGETFVSGIRVNLYGCYVGGNLYTATNQARMCTSSQIGGTWQLVRSKFTDINGSYEFTGLNTGYYFVRAIKNGLLNGATQTGDPNRTVAGVCGTPGCDNRWNDSTLFVNNATGQIPLLQNCRDTLKINFGYTINPAVWGRVWEDIDSSGAKGTGETYLSGWTVKLYNDANQDGIPDGASIATSLTDAGGQFSFTNLTAGNHYLIIPDTTSIWNATWDPGAPTRVGYYRFNAPAAGISGPYDFGYKKTGTSDIGDRVFWDWNGNGTQDVTDAGIPNITVQLWRDNNNDGYPDVFVKTTITNATGYYSFSNLPAGNWIVIVNKTGEILSANATKDPDETGACTICDSRSTVTTDGTADQLNEDFGYQPGSCGSVGDLVYKDQNGNGVSDGGNEAGIASITVSLYQDIDGNGLFSLMESTETDASGLYLFDSLPNGNYRVDVSVSDPQLPLLASPTSYSSYHFTVSGCQTNITTLGCSNCPALADFGFGQPATIGNMVYWDANENGEQDYTESGIGNVTVNLYRKTGGTDTLYGTTTTSNGGTYPAGYYEFTVLPADTFIVVVDHTDPQLLGAPQTADPDNDGYPCSHPYIGTLYPPCDHRDTLILASGQNYSLADFGYSPPGVIGDYVWEDFNNSGTQDPGEPGKAGLVVYLCSGSNPCSASSPNLISSDTTDNDGHYIFYNIPDGTYNVLFGIPIGYFPTTGPQSVGLTGVVVISGGNITSIDGTGCSNCDLNVDLGIRLNGNYFLTGNVCIDDGSLDGLCGNAGDDGLEGLTVYLYRFNGFQYVPAGSTQTTASGDYIFTGLTNGTYIISLGTTDPLLEGATLTTTDGDSPSGDIVQTAATVYHNNIIINNANRSDFDFAFALPNREFGDLPDTYHTYLASNGARHTYNPAWKTGEAIDAEPDAFVSGNALGDDNNTSPNDEDGVTFNNAGFWDPGETVSVTILYSIPTGQSAHLIGWMDWDQNGSFTGNMIFDTLVTSSGSPGTYSFQVPLSISTTSTLYASRFRLFAEEQPVPQLAYSGLPSGSVLFGEVEDYLTVLMSPPNDPPVAVDDFNTTTVNTPVDGIVLGNDYDPEGNPITVNTTPVTPPSHGSVTIHSNGSYTYTPGNGYVGTDTFVYEICDPYGECDTATVTITIHKCIDPPSRPGQIISN
ncbi:MAG TPA: SdrD B-like domain-containing protein [Bacteroidales bacterium]|nr:SdrD B-like domain-containing protein [Bacteroidales bacterium]HSA42582.1 SdrD B-like domain-containing protein [Bacteroidales bacterium]